MRKPLFLWLGCLAIFAALTLAGLHSGSRTTQRGMAAVMGLQNDGYTVIVDAGHGGEDGGATSISGVLESQINLEIARRVDSFLALLGFPTTMTRESDTAIYDATAETISEKKVSDLKNRVQIVNQTAKGVLVSIHQNMFEDRRYSGAQVFYAGTESSQALAERAQEQLRLAVDTDNQRQIKPAETIYLMNHIQCPGILVECGFLSNEAEDLLLQDGAYQKKLALAIGAAVNGWAAEEQNDSEV